MCVLGIDNFFRPFVRGVSGRPFAPRTARRTSRSQGSGREKRP